jgi:ADP-ribose pyrophosphatase
VAVLTCLPYSISMPKSFRKKAAPQARVISSRVVYHGPAFRVTADEVLEPSGVRTRRDIVHHSGSAVILAIEEGKPEPRVLLEHQYRHAARQMLWELPAGRIDEGENDLAAAKRELLEETGYTASRWRRILHFYASPGFLAEAMNLYCASGLHPGPAQPEADEVIHVRMVPLSAAIRMVMRGTIKDGKTIAGILWLSQSRKGSKPHR